MIQSETEKHEIELIVDRIDSIRTTRGLSLNALSLQSGISNNTLQYIYKRKSFPNIATILRLCDTFEMSLGEFFMYYDENTDQTRDEMEFIDLFRNIDFSSKKALLEIMKVLR